MAKRWILILLLTGCFNGKAAYGQEYFKFEILGAYSNMFFANPKDSLALEPEWQIIKFSISPEGNRHQYASGIKTGAAYNLNRYLGIVGEFGWNHGGSSFFQTAFVNAPSYIDQTFPTQIATVRHSDESRNRYSFLAGPRFSMNLAKKFRPFVEAKFGMNRNSSHASRIYDLTQKGDDYFGPVTITSQTNIIAQQKSENSFTLAGGAGLDLKISDRFSLRLIEIEVLNSRETPWQYFAFTSATVTHDREELNYTFEASDMQWGDRKDRSTNNLNISFGIIFHFGK